MTRRLLLAWLVIGPALVRAAYPPQDPSASLDALLRDVWAQGAGKTYDLFMGKNRVPMSAAARAAFPKEMIELAESYSLAGMLLQKRKSEFYEKGHPAKVEAFADAYFVHFMRSDLKSDAITERIYLNVNPDHAAEVIRFLVKEVVTRGIVEAKVATPDGLEMRADAILIYASSLGDVDWALGKLEGYQAQHGGHFLKDLPAATRPRMTGVSTAAEPVASLKADSFGSYLTKCVEMAMKSPPAPADFTEFRKRVRAAMSADGVDPDHPDRLTRRP